MFKKLFRFIMEDAGTAGRTADQSKQRRVTVQPRNQTTENKALPAKSPVKPPVKSKTPGTGMEDKQAIQQAIAEANRLVELEDAASGEEQGRRDLIHAAMNIYRAKQASLEGLEPEDLARLRLLSETVAEAKKPKTH